jgi:NAD(P)-dependent dehydrogenase (short-subunit alcohol dehydrogenase family)
MRFDGKCAVVTGGALGIGQATCELLAERGAAVAILDWDEKAGNETCEKIEQKGGRAIFQKVDVADFAAVETAVNYSRKAFGKVNSLIVSAGIQRYGTAVTTSEEQWEEVLNVNLKGAWNAARASIPFLQESGGGTIVNVSSVQARASQQNVLAYTISKHGLLGLTRSMAMDFAKDNIRTNCVCPGTVDTPMLKWAASLDPNPQSVYDACNAMHPIGRIAQPREIAEVVAF